MGDWNPELTLRTLLLFVSPQGRWLKQNEGAGLCDVLCHLSCTELHFQGADQGALEHSEIGQ